MANGICVQRRRVGEAIVGKCDGGDCVTGCCWRGVLFQVYVEDVFLGIRIRVKSTVYQYTCRLWVSDGFDIDVNRGRRSSPLSEPRLDTVSPM